MIFGILYGLFACKSDVSFEGTLVGNPGRGVTRVAEGENIQFSTGSGRVTTIEYTALVDGVDTIETKDVDIEVDLVKPTTEIPLQPGDWLAIQLNFDSSTTFAGEREMGGSFQMEMSAVAVSLSHENQFSIVEGGAYVIELGEPGWLEDADFDAALGEDVLLSAGDAALEELQNRINNYSGIYVDENEDGSLDDDEREDGLLAAGDDHSDHLSSDVNDPGESDEDDQ